MPNPGDPDLDPYDPKGTTMSLPTLLRGAALLLLAAAPLASQQTLTLRGELDEGRSTGCYYCPNVPYTIKYSETPVRSSTVDLSYYKALSAQLILHGNWDTTKTPAGLEVTRVEVVTESLSVGNTAKLGSPLRFSIYGPAGSVARPAVALGNGFLPLFQSALLIDPLTLVPIGTNTIDSSGQWRFDLTVPNDAGLVGLRFWTQALIAPPSATPFLSNPERTQIQR
ncbi:MAG: hypothetical protein KDC87_12215 [Planctomycetes bacterium]|nr:hypothetical protein [Planctomycetota bacterium]